MLLEIRSNTGEVKIVAAPSDNDRETAGIQQDSALSLSFTAFECVALDVYDYVDFLGRRYILTEAYMPQMNARGEWAYSVKFSGVEALAAQTLMVNPTDGTDNPVVTLTAPAAEHAALIVANLNRRTGSSDWQVGEVIETPYLDIDYTGKNAAEAVAALAEAAGTEWWFDAMTLNICRCEFGEPIELEYGGILLGGIKRGVADGATFFTRLFPLGSTRNIDPDKYGHARLQLPDGSRYVDSRTDLGIIEAFEEDAFAGIYPRRVGKVGEVRSEQRTGEDGVDYTVWYFTDPDLPFNPNDYEIGGLVKKVTFQSGELRGRVFEVNYDTAGKEFEIITQWPYENDVQLPTPPLIPATGDEYVLWNISMPESYYPAAEEEYRQAVDEFIADKQREVTQFSAPTDCTVVGSAAAELRPGRRVRIVSAEYFPETGYRETRIISVSRSVENPANMTLTMGDVLSSGRLQRIENGLSEISGATSRIETNLSSSSQSLQRKLDRSVFYDLFEKVNIGTASKPKYAIRAKYSFYTDGFLSAMGLNPGTGSGGGGGATALSELSDVQLSGLLAGDVLIYDGTHWVNRPQSSIVPDLSEYATRTWVQQQGFATTAALTGYATQSWVKGLGYITASALTPYITEATANATFATKLGVSGSQIGTYVNGKLGNLITVPYAANAASLATVRTLWGQPFDGTGNIVNPAKMQYLLFTAIDGTDAGYIGRGSSTTDAIYILSYKAQNILFTTDGNIGIGTNAPAYKLDVAGAIRVQNRLYFGDSAHYIEVDSNGYFHFSHGLYTDGFLSALGLNSSGGGGTGGATYDRLDAWGDYTADKAGWVLSAGLGYDLHSRVRSLEGGSALSFTTEGTGNVVTAVKKSGTAVTVTKGLTALTAHQPIYSLTFQAGAFEAKKYTPNTGVATVNIPTKVSHLSNDSGFITAAALTGYATQSWVKQQGYLTSIPAEYITETELDAKGYALSTTKVVAGTGLTGGGALTGNVTLSLASRKLWGQTFDGTGNIVNPAKMQYLLFTAIDGTDAGYIGRGSSTTDAIYILSYKAQNILFTTDGNIGIGTNAPAYKCHVNGSMCVNGSTTLAGALSVSGAITGATTITASGIMSAQGYKGNYINIECTDTGAAAGQQINGRNKATIHIQYQTGNVTLCAKGGMVGIGLNTPSYALDVNGVVHSNGGLFSDGYVSAKGQNTASDARLKRRIADVALTVRDVAEAPVYRFEWINGGAIDVGSTAQYWAARVPELTHRLPDGIHLGLDYGKAALLSVVAVARSTADHERRIADIERQLQNRTI